MGWNDLALELEVAKAEFRQLKDERFGKQSSKDPIDPARPPPIKKNLGNSPSAPAPSEPGTVDDGLKRIEPMLTPIYEAIQRSSRFAMMLLFIFATLGLWNPKLSLSSYTGSLATHKKRILGGQYANS